MSLLESFTTALQGIMLHKLRSFLTILGIIFGVGAVIAMMSIGAGAEAETLKQIESFGAKNITVKAKNLLTEQLRDAKRKHSEGLSLKDAEHIKVICPFVENIAALSILNKNVRYGKTEPKANIVGIDENYRNALNIIPENGRFINQEDTINYRKVCVLGAEVAKKLFHNENPLEKVIKIGGFRFIVIGTMPDATSQAKSATSIKIDIQSRDINNDIYIPLSVARYNFPISRPGSGWENSEKDPSYNSVSELIIQVKSMEHIEPSKKIIESVLKRRHKEVDDYEIIIPVEKLRQSQQTQKIFNIVMTGISSLSLLVGGIGIMNIMLATVTERTKEIGIRRAIGARKNDILVHFLIEASVLSMIGGIIGIITGVGISSFVASQAGWQTIVTFYSVFISFFVSALTGIIFGFFPAMHAAGLDPIICLRYE